MADRNYDREADRFLAQYSNWGQQEVLRLLEMLLAKARTQKQQGAEHPGWKPNDKDLPPIPLPGVEPPAAGQGLDVPETPRLTAEQPGGELPAPIPQQAAGPLPLPAAEAGPPAAVAAALPAPLSPPADAVLEPPPVHPPGVGAGSSPQLPPQGGVVGAEAELELPAAPAASVAAAAPDVPQIASDEPPLADVAPAAQAAPAWLPEAPAGAEPEAELPPPVAPAMAFPGFDLPVPGFAEEGTLDLPDTGPSDESLRTTALENVETERRMREMLMDWMELQRRANMEQLARLYSLHAQQHHDRSHYG